MTNMVVSAAFRELAELLEYLDRSDVTVEEISVVEESVRGSDEISADMTVSVTLFGDTEFPDGVSITSDGVDLLEEDLEVELTVSVDETADLETPGGGGGERSPVAGPGQSTDAGSPAYKDPDALREVYERYDSFPQMTEALGVDVTPETVRRHMVKYGIHDADGSGSDGEPAESATATDDGSSGTAGGESREDGGDADPNLSERPVAELLAQTERDTGAERPVTDGNGIPRDLTVGQLASTLETSRTVYEVTRDLDAGYETTRGLLEELDLLGYVNGRLSGERTEITPADVCRRMGVDEVTA